MRYSRNGIHEVFGKAVQKLWMSRDPDRRRNSKPHGKGSGGFCSGLWDISQDYVSGKPTRKLPSIIGSETS